MPFKLGQKLCLDVYVGPRFLLLAIKGEDHLVGRASVSHKHEALFPSLFQQYNFALSQQPASTRW